MKTIKSSNNNVLNWQRKLIFGITSIVMISFVVFTMNSCNKEIGTVTHDSQLSINQDPTARVKAFKEMLKSQEEGNLELRTTYTEEELIWNVEANMNYYLDNAEVECIKFEAILNKIFLKMHIGYTKEIPPRLKSYWYGIGTYGKRNIDLDKGPELELGNSDCI